MGNRSLRKQVPGDWNGVQSQGGSRDKDEEDRELDSMGDSYQKADDIGSQDKRDICEVGYWGEETARGRAQDEAIRSGREGEASQ